MRVRSIAGGVEVLAPAKLNLFLEVLGRRPDGYHEIETVMVAVSLYDTLTFRDDPSGAIRLRCSDPTLPVGTDNLVIKAADRLRDGDGLPAGCRDRPDEGDPGAGRTGRRLERRRGDPGGPGSALGSAIGPGAVGCPGGGGRQRRTVLQPCPRRGLSRPGRAGGAGIADTDATTLCWSVPRSG